MKRQPTEWGKLFVNHISGKILIFRMYIFIKAKGLNGHFSMEDIKMANKPKKWCSTPVIIREIPMKPEATASHSLG